MLAAAAGWDGLAAELHSAVVSNSSVSLSYVDRVQN
jgi:PPE-repeat protein